MIIQTSDFKVIQEIDTIPKTSHLMFSPKGSILATWEPYTSMCSIYRSTSLSQSPREWRKYFEISEVRHIKQNVSSPNYQSPLILTALFQHDLINVSYLTACYLYQVMMTLHFLYDVANDAESTQKSKITS